MMGPTVHSKINGSSAHHNNNGVTTNSNKNNSVHIIKHCIAYSIKKTESLNK